MQVQADASGAKAFEIRVDSATAEVGLDQIRSLVHPTGGTTSPNRADHADHRHRDPDSNSDG